MTGMEKDTIGLAEVCMLIRSLEHTIRRLDEELERLDEDSDDRGNLINDLTLCDTLMEKLKRMEIRRRDLLGGGNP